MDYYRLPFEYQDNTPASRWPLFATALIFTSIVVLFLALKLLRPADPSSIAHHNLEIPKLSFLSPEILPPPAVEEYPTTIPLRYEEVAKEVLPAATWQHITVTKGSNLSTIFKQLHLSDQLLFKVMASGKAAKKLTKLKAKEQINFLLTDNGKLLKLSYKLALDKSLVISRLDNGKFLAKIEKNILKSRTKLISTTINNSLLAAGIQAGLHKKLIYDLINIFSWEINFTRDLRSGDQLKVLYEEYYDGDKKVSTGDILAAEITVKNKTHHAIRFYNSNGHYDYYNEKGQSLRKAFSRKPVSRGYISSHFNKHRYHPVLHITRPPLWR